MEQLTQITEQLASAVMRVDADDMTLLASMHDQLMKLAELAGLWNELEVGQIRTFQGAAKSAEKLVEQLVLREVTDTQQALAGISKGIAELREWVESPQKISSGPDQPQLVESAAPAAVEQVQPPPPDGVISADDAPLVREFITEANSHIEAAEGAVLQLEEDPRNLEVVNSIFRSFHTIKGVAGFLNLRQIGSLAHAAENLLDLARHGKIVLEGFSSDVVLESIDMMKGMIGALDQAVNAQTAPASDPRLSGLLVKLKLAAEGASAPPAQAADSPAPVASEKPADKPAEAPQAASKQGTSQGDGTVKVATDRLDRLINMVGELVISQSMVSQDVLATTATNQRLARNMSQLGKITRELQDLSMSMRMVPVQGVFQKMARLARDVSRKAGKAIDFVQVGAETELDRNVVEAISDPLVHMVRNSIDHGVETAEQRRAAGKPETGRVELRAFHQGGNIVIEISDDGRGLNKARILKKAIDNGLVREGQELTEQEIFKLIFAAGLSTAEKVTDISGRGVGMDVVRRNIEALRGRIDIASVEGKGSTFSIRLPLTLAIIDGQIVTVGQHRYIIPINSIDQTIRPAPSQLSTVQERGEIVMVREKLLPLLRLHRVFNVTPRFQNPADGLVVIVQDDQKRCCLFVDELLGQQQVVIKTLGDRLGQVPGISGGAILGDGNVSLILDIPGLMRLATQD